MSKLVCGVGINDADYNVLKRESINGKSKVVWVCPFYTCWANMIGRCYSEKAQVKRKKYIGCSVVPEWHYFMTFRAWMIEQDWEGNCLDKDLLVRGNKIYGPDTCVFIGNRVNLFITESDAIRGEWPIGVTFNKHHNKFQAQCGDVISGKNKHLGYFLSAEEAHDVWLGFKLQQAMLLASDQDNPRVAEAIVKRYQNYRSNENL